jgi:hypothetical protein
VPYKTADLLDGHPVAGQQRHERVAQLPRGPVLPDSRIPTDRRSDRRTLPASSLVPRAVVNTSPCSCQSSPARRRALAWRSWCSVSAATAIAGSARERRDLLVLTSPWARTERHTSTCGGRAESASRWT